jgi:hypothetical protein
VLVYRVECGAASEHPASEKDSESVPFPYNSAGK